MRIIIVGAGIAGLATALSLDAAGFRDIEIYERADEIRGLGVGINLLPHAMREITELGLADQISKIGVEPSTLSYFNRHGQPIWSEPRGTRAGYEWPQMSVHRGRLQLALRDAVLDRLGNVIRLGHRLLSITGESTVTARFQTSGGERVVSGGLLIAADGIHSAARALRYPDEGNPQWGGLTLWRGTTYMRPFLDGKTMIMVGDGDQKFVAYPLTPAGEHGLQRVNFIAEKRGGGTAEVDWNRRIDPGPIADSFAGWRFDWLDVPAAISNAEEILEYPMVDR
ncbi:FAD-dependent monooxygenase, partial [Microbacterium sp. ISL-103]|uniref:FAD-dependent monooxygenase n=1 Tax=Microbacterium sp. ISL-103 TaxID=2819156 RepID=UPI001BE8F028